MFASLLAALVCVATMLIKVPSPLKGYLNLGDGVVLLAGWTLSPVYGFLAAGVGSALADLLSGYVLYAPVTLVIKGLMALVAYGILRTFSTGNAKRFAGLVGGVTAEVIMVLGYYAFEGLLYGFGPAAVNIPANAVQGVAGIIVGMLLRRLFEKSKVVF